MHRRRFLASAFAATLAVPAAQAFESDGPNRFCPQQWRQFRITTHVTLPNTSGAVQLWLPLAQTAGDYQIASAPGWGGEDRAKLVHDPRYGAPVAWMSWEEGDPAPRRLEVQQVVALRDRATDSQAMLPLTEAERRFWTTPTVNMPLDGIVLATAAKITAGRSTPRERLRALYDWVVENTHRDPDVPGCGRGDTKTMLATGSLGGKCADINGLLIGLARATGFPAREVYGIRTAPSRLFPSLGVSGEITKAQHCRAEVFLEGEGWLPVDPADVRKVVLQDKIPLDAEEVRALRDHQFGNWEMNWIGYNSAEEIELPGRDGLHRPDFAFLMYPCALTSEENCPCTDPARFRYEITSTELIV